MLSLSIATRSSSSRSVWSFFKFNQQYRRMDSKGMEHGAESHLRKPSLWCSATRIGLTHHLSNLDYTAESEYQKFIGEEVTIAKCYISVIHHLASVPAQGVIQLIWTVTKIEWQRVTMIVLHFLDGSTVFADQCSAAVVSASFFVWLLFVFKMLNVNADARRWCGTPIYFFVITLDVY